MSTILLIDDDDQLRKSFTRILSQEKYRIVSASSGEEGIEIIREASPDLAVVDYRLPGMDGLETFKAIHRLDPKLPVVMMTAYGTTDIAINAIKEGVFDFILKPFDIPDMLIVIEKALETARFMRMPVDMNITPGQITRETIIGQSQAMQDVYKAIGRVASTDATVLIRGESGTGKELVARAVYQYSDRADKPFQVINCVAIPDHLLESELFGYEKGAFTGAAYRKIGKVEQADSGTIFLDEIGDMPLALQAKLLRLLQDKRVERLGSHKPIPVDVRIIAATNRDLEAAIADGSFREDLYYRLKVVTIKLPPLREKLEDIPSLANYFISQYGGLQAKGNPGISDKAMQLLSNYAWPGNVREFANIIQKTLIFNRGGPIAADDIVLATDSQNETIQANSENGEIIQLLQPMVRRVLESNGPPDRFDAFMDSVAKLFVREALAMTGGNRSKTAKLLGMSRPTLNAKIEKYSLSLNTVVNSDSSGQKQG